MVLNNEEMLDVKGISNQWITSIEKTIEKVRRLNRE